MVESGSIAGYIVAHHHINTIDSGEHKSDNNANVRLAQSEQRGRSEEAHWSANVFTLLSGADGGGGSYCIVAPTNSNSHSCIIQHTAAIIFTIMGFSNHCRHSQIIAGIGHRQPFLLVCKSVFILDSRGRDTVSAGTFLLCRGN